ncbi:hypothetical protein N0V86_009115 [Didymella sp. IMI 355093]|nr:hypothetical protein N0V86_009115 [Didymella sp. IMI 355093]
MSQLGQVRIGHKAPDFHCEAVIGGTIKEVSLSTFIRPSRSPSTPNPDAPWLLLLFIPAAFSFVCPTEVVAFQNCYDEFRDRHCSVAFVSVDTKHSLWHWQNVPRQYGGLGNVDIPLLSDATHKIGRDYGVLMEDEGVSLRGMFIIDGEGLSYEDRLANLQQEFGNVQVTDLDAKHKAPASTDDIPHAEFVETLRPKVNTISPESLKDVTQASADARDPPSSPSHTNCVPRVDTEAPREQPIRSNSDQGELSHPSSPITAVATPVSTPSIQDPPPMKLHTQERTARHSRGHHSAHYSHKAHSAPPKRPTHLDSRLLEYQSETGSHVTLEFADPLSSPLASPSIELNAALGLATHSAASPARPYTTSRRSAPVLSRATSWSAVLRRESSAGTPALTPTLSNDTVRPTQTRLQSAFHAIRKMSAGLTSPRLDPSPDRRASGERSPGYFDGVTEEAEES